MKDVRELLDRKASGDRDLPPIAGTFLRGLSLGALVGAAIAGSAIWRRVRHVPVEREAQAVQVERPPAPEG
jgi:hypothetical protein